MIFNMLLSSLLFLVPLLRAEISGAPENLEPTEPGLFQPQDFKIIPGITKQLLIDLKGINEDISFSFQSDTTDKLAYEIQVIRNQIVDSTQVTRFLEPEVFTLELDYQTMELVISGDQTLSLRKSIQEKDYELNIVHNRGPEGNFKGQTLSSTELAKRERTLYVYGLGVAIGVCGVCGFVLLSLKLKYLVKNKRKRGLIMGEIIAKYFKLEDFSNKGLENTRETLNQVDSRREPTIIGSKILDGIVDKSMIEIPNTKNMFEAEKIHKEIKLSFDLEPLSAKSTRRAPTHSEIKALVRRMEAERLVEKDCDSPLESESQEENEVPELPNYFCCMLCFQGMRCTLVHPCRHVFACGECMEEVLVSYKVCLLCASEITGYEPLNQVK